MSHARSEPPRPVPHLVATGFTTALLGDERTLREFVVGDDVVRSMNRQGHPAALLLVNDSYDPLNERQLRVGVNKDPEHIRRFASFCGRPLAEIPDPFECHATYSDHFVDALCARLDRIDIHPVVLDAHQVYRGGHYAHFIRTVFERYAEIQEALTSQYGMPARRDLFRVQCARCSCIDATRIEVVADGCVTYRCRRCDTSASAPVGEVLGKLSWKLDCAARWNLYRIDTETFAKAHLAPQGTVPVAQFVSQTFFKGRVPETVGYGHLRLSRSCSGRLLDILPPAVFKAMLLEHRSRDLDITRDYVETFCRKFEVSPGMSYVDYVRRELPRQALEHSPAFPTFGVSTSIGNAKRDALIAHANEFARFYYGKPAALRPFDRSTLEQADLATLRAAGEVVAHALALRTTPGSDTASIRQGLRAHLASRDSAPALYPFLRHLLGQEDGPNIATLLAILPHDYLGTLALVLDAMTGAATSREQGNSEDLDTLAA